MKYDRIDSGLYVENRRKYSARLKENSLAIFHSNDLMPRNGDQFHEFRQDSDLLWLSGIDQEESFLLIYPDCPIEKYREVLFIRRTNELIKVWEGAKFTQEEAREISGIRTVIWNEQYDAILKMLMNHAKHVYLNLNENDRAKTEVPNRNMRLARELQQNYPLHQYHRSGPVMTELRTVKATTEIALMRHACGITHKAFRKVLSFVKPGVWEYEIEAEITAEFLRSRANGHAYHPIIASGEDTCVLHYDKNNKQCMDGDLLLMDFGADYANYASDMTRTIPVSGKFTERQKAVYNACLRVMKEATQMMQPGIILDSFNQEVGKVMESELIGLGLLDKAAVAGQDPDKPLYKQYFMHGTSHFIGLDTHDIGNRYSAIPAGAVLTCEPGIYIPEERIGIRLENDIQVTNDGPVDLMSEIPLEADEIEELMQSKVVL